MASYSGGGSKGAEDTAERLSLPKSLTDGDTGLLCSASSLEPSLPVNHISSSLLSLSEIRVISKLLPLLRSLSLSEWLGRLLNIFREDAMGAEIYELTDGLFICTNTECIFYIMSDYGTQPVQLQV